MTGRGSSGLVRVGAGLLVVVGVAGYLAERRSGGSHEPLSSRRDGNAGERREARPMRDVPPRAQREGEPGRDVAPPGASPRSAAADRARRNQEGVDAAAAGVFDRAVKVFEALVDEWPKVDAFRANLARSLAGRARACHDEHKSATDCIADLERAVLLLPDDEGLSDWLARWRREVDVEVDFASADSPYFELTFDGERSELVHGSQDFLDRLEAAYTDFRLWFSHDPVLDGKRRPFRVVLYDRSGFESLTGLGDWAQGAFDGSIRLPLEPGHARAGEWDSVLRHELVHGFVQELGGDSVPGWLNEGLAQWLSGPLRDRASRARRALAGKELLDLDELRGSLIGMAPDKVSLAYSQSLAWVDYLMSRHGGEALLRMVRGCARGETVAASFEAWTRVPLDIVFDDFANSL